jgi:glycosyltransferase involved in cell wall biosynthesis
VQCGALLSGSDLGTDEAAALREVDAFLAPSRFMKTILERLAGADRPILVVEPGTVARRARAALSAEGGVRAVLVANLVPGKGVVPFLRMLGAELSEEDPFRLIILGGSALSPQYASVCWRLIADEPKLRDRVVCEGAVSPEKVLERLGESNLLVSASVMESYGMALAEARTIGIPIVARDGGNVMAHVREDSGGELASDERGLAVSCVRLCRNPREHAERLDRALANALSPRPWAFAAHDFLAEVKALPPRDR